MVSEDKSFVKRLLTETWPAKMAQDALSALMLPGDVYQGKVSMYGDDGRTNPEVINRSADLAGLVTLGAGAVPAEANSLRSGIKAYHGSPHDFERFDLSKIGTGEGAQAYGHGLYFADNEAVARSYRDTLSKQKRSDPAYWADKTLPQDLTLAQGDELRRLGQKMRLNGNLPAEEMAQWKELHAIRRNYEGAIDAQAPQGRMYEVNINADPARFLDWDKPKFQQSEQVKAALQGLGVDTSPQQVWTVEPTKNGKFTVRNVWGEASGTFADQARAQAKADLGTQKHYSGSGGLIYTNLGGNAAYPMLDKGLASQKLREAGIPGIKYLDQGSRGAGEGSRNYVVFDDNMIDILKKYGLAGASASPLAALMASQSQGELQQ